MNMRKFIWISWHIEQLHLHFFTRSIVENAQTNRQRSARVKMKTNHKFSDRWVNLSVKLCFLTSHVLSFTLFYLFSSIFFAAKVHRTHTNRTERQRKKRHVHFNTTCFDFPIAIIHSLQQHRFCSIFIPSCPAFTLTVSYSLCVRTIGSVSLPAAYLQLLCAFFTHLHRSLLLFSLQILKLLVPFFFSCTFFVRRSISCYYFAYSNRY